MKLLTRHSDYAIRALTYLARKKRLVSINELCEKLALPRSFMRNLLQTLSKKGVLTSFKGKDGGFKLNVPVSSLSIYDVMNIFQKPVTVNKCRLKTRPCPHQKTCKVRKKVRLIEKKVLKDLKKISLKSVL
jgi:Rrf2 family protein